MVISQVGIDLSSFDFGMAQELLDRFQIPALHRLEARESLARSEIRRDLKISCQIPTCRTFFSQVLTKTLTKTKKALTSYDLSA